MINIFLKCHEKILRLFHAKTDPQHCEKKRSRVLLIPDQSCRNSPSIWMSLYFGAHFTNIAVHQRPIKQALLHWRSCTACARRIRQMFSETTLKTTHHWRSTLLRGKNNKLGHTQQLLRST